MAEDEEESQLLVIVFDVNPVWWGVKSLQGKAQITKCLDCLLVFVNSFLMLNHRNKIAFIASHSSKSVYLYPSGDGDEEKVSSEQSIESGHAGFTNVNNAVTSRFKELMKDGCGKDDIRSDSLIAGSMANALCYIHKILSEDKGRSNISPRMLIIKVADDAASQYLSFMNVIFAAQKEDIAIDACVLGQDSGLLQQACGMTGGIYFKVPTQESLLQYLLTIFLPEPRVRKDDMIFSRDKFLGNVDYRAACFCHRNLIEIGFVCSVCLSIFCQFSPICSTCETVFKVPVSLKPRKRKKAVHSNGSSAS